MDPVANTLSGHWTTMDFDALSLSRLQIFFTITAQRTVFCLFVCLPSKSSRFTTTFRSRTAMN
ncbi:UNVERIFIED_CONTAM: hypothetical protein GTU68_000362 [Idotea baltica]|nr:hypothetical protein [Idotea baltica]